MAGFNEAGLVVADSHVSSTDVGPGLPAYALSMHVISYLLTGLIGGYALYKDGESLSSLYTRLGKMKSEGEA